MLAGEYSHNIDPKGRLTIPSKFRKVLGTEFMVTKGLDKCLSIYPESEWKRMEEKLREMSLTTNQVARKFIRFMLGSAVEGGLDKQGRILLPQPLKAYAGLDKEVVLVGVMDRIEVWDKDKWEQNQAHDEPKEFSHKPVLLNETVDGLMIKPGGVYADGTLGGGGHAYAVCEKLGNTGKYFGIDRDDAAIKAATARLAGFGELVTIVKGNYRDMKPILSQHRINLVDGIILDLGVIALLRPRESVIQADDLRIDQSLQILELLPADARLLKRRKMRHIQRLRVEGQHNSFLGPSLEQLVAFCRQPLVVSGPFILEEVLLDSVILIIGVPERILCVVARVIELIVVEPDAPAPVFRPCEPIVDPPLQDILRQFLLHVFLICKIQEHPDFRSEVFQAAAWFDKDAVLAAPEQIPAGRPVSALAIFEQPALPVSVKSHLAGFCLPCRVFYYKGQFLPVSFFHWYEHMICMQFIGVL